MTPYRHPNRDAREWAEFERTDHPGNPLGVGMPSGEPLRVDGESHREAWKRILRGDPCAYCGRRMFPCAFNPDGRTVDHIIPHTKARPNEGHAWLNYTGSCVSCNTSKKDTHLLMWLARRGVLRRR